MSHEQAVGGQLLKCIAEERGLTQARLLKVVHYEPTSGIFTWIERPSKRVRIGQQAGSLGTKYRRIQIDGREYYCHRLVWLYVHGRWPDKEIDHANGDVSDNRLSNLREATRRQNCWNTRARSSLKGVSFHKHSKLWRARISAHGKNRSLGYFETKQKAHEAYVAAARDLQGDFARSA